MAGGIYRFDPPPVQAATCVPIPSQGDQPPRVGPLAAEDLTAILAWQPGPPLPQRDLKNIAPLTLTYGDQPPSFTTTVLNVLLASWTPPPPQPQRDAKNAAPWTVLVYGDQPPRSSSVLLNETVRLWQPPILPATRGKISVFPSTSTHYTSAASGSWQTVTNWTPNGLPGNGDTVTIDGHAITVDSDTAIGTSPSDTTTSVLIIDNAGSLTIKAGKSFTLRGNGYASHVSTLQIGETTGGATWEFDATAASDPTTAYHFDSGHFAFDFSNLIATRGMSGSRSAVRSRAGSGYGSFSRPTTEEYNGVYDLQDTDFLRIGAPGVASFASAVATTSIGFFKVARCTFDICNAFVTVGNIAAGWGLDLQDSTWKNTTNTYCLAMGNITASPTNTRTISGCVFDGQLQIPSDTTTFTDNICLNHIGNPFETGFWADFSRNLLRIHIADGDMARLGDWHQCVMFNDGCTLDPYLGVYTATADVTNPHWTRANIAATTETAYDCIFEDFGSSDDGDVDLHNYLADSHSRMIRCIGLSQDKTNAGCFTISRDGGLFTYEHCTWQSSQVGAAALAEENSPGAGDIVSFRSNILWRNSYDAGVFKIGSYNTGSLNTDIGAPADIDYNCGYNVNTTGGVGTKGYDLPMSSAPGAHDVDANPQFVDSTRNFSSWVASIEASWSGNATPSRTDYNARGLHKLRLKNEPSHTDYDARYTLTAYKTYLRAGFAPQNASLRNAGHDSVTIGAVEWVGGAPVYRPQPWSALAAWHVTAPRSQSDQKRLAPLTLVYGSQPPIQAGMLDQDVIALIAASWQPGPSAPQRDTKHLAPLTLTYGDQPPPYRAQQWLAPLQQPWPCWQQRPLLVPATATPSAVTYAPVIVAMGHYLPLVVQGQYEPLLVQGHWGS